eukprot:TRINITY_DN6599_c0_g1_i1.p1 TRINITY_DN6599_c0_g1~~TRINITY_DN6599_c0_g1_i1.p1  ORF type:complete len:683 (+),score=177.77 TRINITY_DN6599_c0_g1_i1:86-2134(+)
MPSHDIAVLRICCVCGQRDRPGKLRRSGWKCKECIGKSSRSSRQSSLASSPRLSRCSTPSVTSHGGDPTGTLSPLRLSSPAGGRPKQRVSSGSSAPRASHDAVMRLASVSSCGCGSPTRPQSGRLSPATSASSTDLHAGARVGVAVTPLLAADARPRSAQTKASTATPSAADLLSPSRLRAAIGQGLRERAVDDRVRRGVATEARVKYMPGADSRCSSSRASADDARTQSGSPPSAPAARQLCRLSSPPTSDGSPLSAPRCAPPGDADAEEEDEEEEEEQWELRDSVAVAPLVRPPPPVSLANGFWGEEGLCAMLSWLTTGWKSRWEEGGRFLLPTGSVVSPAPSALPPLPGPRRGSRRSSGWVHRPGLAATWQSPLWPCEAAPLSSGLLWHPELHRERGRPAVRQTAAPVSRPSALPVAPRNPFVSRPRPRSAPTRGRPPSSNPLDARVGPVRNPLSLAAEPEPVSMSMSLSAVTNPLAASRVASGLLAASTRTVAAGGLFEAEALTSPAETLLQRDRSRSAVAGLWSTLRRSRSAALPPSGVSSPLDAPSRQSVPFSPLEVPRRASPVQAFEELSLQLPRPERRGSRDSGPQTPPSPVEAPADAPQERQEFDIGCEVLVDSKSVSLAWGTCARVTQHRWAPDGAAACVIEAGGVEMLVSPRHLRAAPPVRNPFASQRHGS